MRMISHSSLKAVHRSKLSQASRRCCKQRAAPNTSGTNRTRRVVGEQALVVEISKQAGILAGEVRWIVTATMPVVLRLWASQNWRRRATTLGSSADAMFILHRQHSLTQSRALTC
jgi:hypothetical protein